MKLMSAPQSPFVRKVRATAIELGLADRIELEYAEVLPGRENAKFAAGVNPLRKIPALILDDHATVIVDSTVICEYLDALAGGNRILPQAGPDRWRVLTQHAIAQGMMEALVLVRYETSLRPQSLRWPDWINDQLDKFWTGLSWFEDRAASSLDIGTRSPDLSQIALACCLEYFEFRFPGTDWIGRFPRVTKWHQSISLLPCLLETRPKNPPVK
jgi:glutathione S-transferase